MIEPVLDSRLTGIHKRFLELLAGGRYHDAKIWLTGIRIRATAERDDSLYYFSSLLMGICLQQEGDLPVAGRILRQVIKGTRDQFVKLSGRIHLSKVYSQSGRFEKATKALLKAVESVERLKGAIDRNLSDQLRLPILWRLGLAERLTGSANVGQRHLDEHFELSAISTYQRANALAVRAILFAGGDRQRRFTDVEESLKEATLVYSGSSIDPLNSFAFKGKAELGMDLLEAVLDLQSGRKVSAYAKLHMVRFHAQERGIRPASEGFAEMIYPALISSPSLIDLLTVPEATYEGWMSSQADWEALREGRLMAHDLIDAAQLMTGGGSSPGSKIVTSEEGRPMTRRYDAFISYRHKEPDRTFAQNLVKELESHSYNLAIDERDFDPNEMFLTEMERCIKESRFTLAIVSPRYLESGNTVEEAIICKVLDMAERRRRLIPITCEPVHDLPVWLYGIVGIDFTVKSPLLSPMERLRRTLGAPGGGP